MHSLVVTRPEEAVAVIAIDDPPLNRMTLAFVVEREALEELSAARCASLRTKAPRAGCPSSSWGRRRRGAAWQASPNASAAPTPSTSSSPRNGPPCTRR